MTTTTGDRADARETGVRDAISASSAAIIAAIAIATCAAAPEFIWQGLKIVATHLTSATLASAVLVALLLVFFVEPILERLRGWLTNTPEPAHSARHHLAIAAAIGFFIALVSVGLHDAMSTFTTGEGEHNVSLERAVTVAISWGAVPFAVALAWQAAANRYLAIVVGIVAAASPFIAGWWFDWGLTTTLATAVPCLFIQMLGYRHTGDVRDDASFARYAPTLAAVAIFWLLFSPAYDAVIDLVSKASWPPLYAAADYFIDVRFYIGWFLGLLLTRSPARSTPQQSI